MSDDIECRCQSGTSQYKVSRQDGKLIFVCAFCDRKIGNEKGEINLSSDDCPMKLYVVEEKCEEWEPEVLEFPNLQAKN